jgi:uncharacterized protein YdeI (YjbR/CyaY-like superfamily)
MEYSKTVDAYFKKEGKWKGQLNHLRELLNRSGLKEELKWGKPSYSLNGKLIVGIADFKNHYAIWFHQGVFLKDKEKKLVNAQEGITKSLRQWRFEKDDPIEDEVILNYVAEAIQNSLDGKEVKPQKRTGVSIPPFLKAALKKDDKFEEAFKKLTPGKQREYANHIDEAKREATKESRLEKIIPMILQGAGLHDKYKNC